MKFIYQLIIILFAIDGATAQQSFEIPHNYNNQFLNNPAATGVWEKLDISAFYSNTFSNVENSPTIIVASAQYAAPKQNAAFGFNLNTEKAGLLHNTSISGSFAYKLRGLATKNDFLSLGLGIRANSLNFDGSNAIVSQLGEPNLGGSESGFGVNFSFGAFYTSSSIELGLRDSEDLISVSYTHLTLPTIYSV